MSSTQKSSAQKSRAHQSAGYVRPAAAAHPDPQAADHDHDRIVPGEKPENDPDQGLIYDGLRVPDGGVCAGVYVARTDDGKVCTHGPDEPLPGLDPQQPVEPVVASAPLTLSSERQSRSAGALAADQSVPCDGDGTSGNRVQVLYVYSGSGRFAAFRDSFVTWSAGIDRIYSASAQETGGDRHVRFVTETVGGQCRPSVVPVQISASALGNFSSSISAVQAAGFKRSDRKYVMWVDDNTYCGIGGFAGDDRKIANNRSNFGPSYGRSDNGCWDPGVAAHELGHNLGAVNDSAPNTSRGGHCVDEYDVMCYSDAPYYPTMVVKCASRAHDQRLDCNHDDYYSTNPAPGSYLATHFNVADNVFLIQGSGGGGGGGGGADTSPPTAPTALTAGKVTATTVSLTWTAATDDTGVAEYDVLRGGTKVGTSATTSLTVQGLTPATRYAFSVIARDAAGNASDPSPALPVTTADGGGGGAGALQPGATGTLTNTRTGKSADVAGADLTDGAPVVQYPTHGGPNQQWTVIDAAGDAVQLQAKHSGLCLAVKNASLRSGTIVVQTACAERPGQLWVPTATSGGYVLTAQHSGKQLTVGSTTYGGQRVLTQRDPATRPSRVWVFTIV